jgi:FeS assembly SUF system regulator
MRTLDSCQIKRGLIHARRPHSPNEHLMRTKLVRIQNDGITNVLKIGKLSDYATMVLTKLASANETQSPPSAQAASQLAIALRIPQPTIAKILKALAKAELVKATRGAEGGYQLAKRPHLITVADVLTIFEGPLGLTDCTTHTGCSHTTYCNTQSHWHTINQAVLTALRAVTIADLAATQRHPYADLVLPWQVNEANSVPITVSNLANESSLTGEVR